MNRSKLFAILELSLAASLWGFGFVATVWALKDMNFFELTWLRYILAAVVGLPFFMLRRGRYSLKELSTLSFWPALLLLATLLLQTWGMHYTTATKSGFITTLYVVFVPLLESILHRKTPRLRVWACVFAASVGTALIVNLGFSDLNRGDLLTLFCALAATVQIYIMGVISPKVREPFLFNLVQCWWAALVLSPFMSSQPLLRHLNLLGHWPWQTWAGVLLLAFGSTMFAFYLQVRAQAKISTTVSSLLCLLESPFALVFAAFFLGERLSITEAAGALLILASAAVASLSEAHRIES